MKINRENRLFTDMVALALLAFTTMDEEEVQNYYGSDYYAELKKYLLADVWKEKEVHHD